MTSDLDFKVGVFFEINLKCQDRAIVTMNINGKLDANFRMVP